MEAQATLVGAKRGVELDAVAMVDLDLALVVLPDNAELDNALRDRDDGERPAVLRVLLEESGVLDGRGEF